MRKLADDKMEKKNIIVELTLDFALKIITYCEDLDSHKKFVISNQLLKSGTSIGANVREAQKAESKKDFIHKLKIADKEANETEYWLTLCDRSKNYPNGKALLTDLLSIQKVLSKIIVSSKNN